MYLLPVFLTFIQIILFVLKADQIPVLAMSRPHHTFGQTCHLSRSKSYTNAKRKEDEVPYLNAQYFYYASYSVDDPLSAIPITSGADSKAAQYPPLPFSARDNNALEDAWVGIRRGFGKKKGTQKSTGGEENLGTRHDTQNAAASVPLVEQLNAKPQRSRGTTMGIMGDTLESGLTSFGSPSNSLRNSEAFPSIGLTSSRVRGLSKSEASTDKHSREALRQESKSDANIDAGSQVLLYDGSRSVDSASARNDEFKRPAAPVEIRSSKTRTSGSASGSISSSLQGGSLGTSGRPFVKLPERSCSPRPGSSSKLVQEQGDFGPPRTEVGDVATKGHDCKPSDFNDDHSDVPVGVSRLYLVELPTLLMKPIYWAHVHDTAPVIRATWFYKDTMLPVEPSVANQLENGYRELRPWSQTWQDELNSAMDVGASGEEKIVHPLWPSENKSSSKRLSADPYQAAAHFDGEASAAGSLEQTSEGHDSKPVKKKFPSSQVIYKDTRSAFILKPTLQPSAYYGRKPLQKIKRGRVVGIEVARGFDRDEWEKLHPPKKVVPEKVAAKVPVSGGTAIFAHTEFCPACRALDEKPNVSDLVLVIHGIGQKLSERVESFNFTHACNSVRRSVNVELGTDAVKKVLRKELGGIMVLPVNWRSNLSFEDGGPRKDVSKEEANADFSLKDITPDTIPAVRNLISDVMLDIPFYMSHHKGKMIAAVVKEANRVYRLWCQNNPGFHEHGRVHIIAHSLGSPMTLEILSRQPTEIGSLDVQHDTMNTEHFDFNTVNLFCAGSPAGFFLLLQNSKLVPRRGRRKPTADLADDEDHAIVGEVGTFGCLAVDNIYNILHCNDPIAYRLNATVDPQYASSLKEAHVPSATTGFFEGIGNAMRNATPGMAPSVDVAVGQVVKPGVLPRLPSQLEMEIHDFTREEIAEKKFYLLNDNCQIDWLLSSGGGPFDIAYLDMLGAHSSYWEKKEFIRLLVTEIGREPGKRTTLPNMRAQKKTYKV